ncbi:MULTISPECIES: sugar phosphate isomerase/epimerase [unclassified Oceanispirochaeta]|uniref:sugar phosphate isomerase/epimerase family protein n=1 Tax=unclassified Oceanispirochaeta TaxID=2635722 RepID=UPI000E08FD99|nr:MULTISPECIES: sugar phosphate isomerase/epimerase family protein [unclassified Oceanispirochaeta]MBF9018026.1 sugar phosphate isomerase/epimerase [Oceanispirochaeta sp. M2]NPD74538.1 sugar phosphate isomerase/epimerase [Oceanispirochaeta sp. M1]RDG29650.1 sugar phosphate isomerase/epimerase [Oceanispirochaeta sp. M1]
MKQNYEKLNQEIDYEFRNYKKSNPDKMRPKLKLSWSNWGFGAESLAKSLDRLVRNNVEYIELHGNHYGPDLGYPFKETRKLLNNAGIKVSGVCGMFSVDNDLSSVSAFQRQAAIDYIRREVEFTAEIGGTYLLVVPAAVGRNAAYDDMEIHRSIETLRIVSDVFEQSGVKGAVEPIRSAETSIIHTVGQAKEYIAKLNCPGVSWINGDVFHMQAEEQHIGKAILEAGNQLVNLHMADSQRGALGTGSLDLDRIIEALYLINYNEKDCFVTPEPLGPGGDPYPAMFGAPDSESLDTLVKFTIETIRSREAHLRETVI